MIEKISKERTERGMKGGTGREKERKREMGMGKR